MKNSKNTSESQAAASVNSGNPSPSSQPAVPVDRYGHPLQHKSGRAHPPTDQQPDEEPVKTKWVRGMIGPIRVRKGEITIRMLVWTGVAVVAVVLGLAIVNARAEAFKAELDQFAQGYADARVG